MATPSASPVAGSPSSWTAVNQSQATYFVVDSVSSAVSPSNVVIQGQTTTSSDVPLVLVIQNTSSQAVGGALTNVSISSVIQRPVLLIFTGCNVATGGRSIWGTVILDQFSILGGNPSITGALAYYHGATIGSPTVNADAQIRAVMADVAPRFILTSVRVFRQ